MALPVINQTPKYEMEIPSTKETVKFRPYLVKEEKIMMMAVESEDQQAAINAVVDTLNACVEGGVDKSVLTTYDVEYMFTQLRTKSVGENAKVNLKCEECGEENPVAIQLDTIKVKFPEEEISNEIKLSDTLFLKMRHPRYSSIAEDNIMANPSPTQQTFDMIAKCIEAVNTEEESILFSDESHADQMAFIESLTKEQLEEIQAFVEGMPRLVHDFEFKCEHCQHENKVHLEGMQNFF